MTVPLARGSSKGFVMNRPPLRHVLFVALVFSFLHLHASGGWCDLYLQFLVDRSGSIWSPINGTPKTVLIADAVEKVSRDLPGDVAMGLRVYPPLRTGGVAGDPGLRIPVRTGTRDRFSGELAGLNPKGKAPLAEHLKKALDDFPETEDSKLLFLITDGADNNGKSFCEHRLVGIPPDSFRFHIFSMNLKDEEKREELNCLSRQFSGKTTHLTSGARLKEKLLSVSRDAHRKETERQARVLEEKRRQEALNSKTRLKVAFHNTLDPFFADSLEVAEFHLDGRKITLDPPLRTISGQKAVIFEQPVPVGTHQLDLQYRMWRGNEFIVSRAGSLEVRVEEGKTSSVLGVPKSAIFHWGCSLKPVSP